MNLEAECKCSCVPIKEESKDSPPHLSFFLLPISRLISRDNNQLGKQDETDLVDTNQMSKAETEDNCLHDLMGS